MLGVFGPSGSGKTSLLESLAGLRRDARGVIRLGDETWLDDARGVRLTPEARRTGYVPQDALLFPHLDVAGNLRAGTRRARARGRDVEQSLADLTRILGLERLLTRPVASLSGGERQRVALGRALASDPALLLLDEPLAALDLPLRRRLLPLLQRVRDETSAPMLLVSHDPNELLALADEVLVLREGVAVGRGQPREVLADPELFSLSEGGVENLLPCRVLAPSDAGAVVRLGESVTVFTRSSALPAGAAALVAIPARDVILARDRPAGLSARNVAPCTVTALRTAGPRAVARVALAPDVPELFVEISLEAYEELGLAPGLGAFAVFKASSCAVLSPEAPDTL